MSYAIALIYLHMHKTVSRCFAVLRQLRPICHSVLTTTLQTLIISLLPSRLDYGNAILAGLPAYLFQHLQSVMNAAARHSDHISDALITLHSLWAQERAWLKVAMLMYKATHGTVPSYLSQLFCVADLPGRRSLHSARTNRPQVPSVKLSTVGSLAYPVAGPTIWNSLPDNAISASSLSTFRQRLKTVLLQARSLTLPSIPIKLLPYLQWTTLKIYE